MANKGFALYKEGKNLYIFSVAYEYEDSRFVGFDEKGDVFKINKLNPEQKEWLKTHDYRQDEKTKHYIFIGDYYLNKVKYEDFPKGKPYTQLPGGGGVYKETRKINFVINLFSNKTILKAIENYGSFQESYNIVRKVIREAIDKLIYKKKADTSQMIGFKMLEKEANKFKTSEELLRSGGFSTKALDLAAFGFTEDNLKKIMPGQLSIKWKDDLGNAIYQQEKSGLSKTEWANKVNLSEPIDVSFDGKKFYIEDGHHRYYAAKILGKPLNVSLEIKANPIAKLSDKGYDEFHRDFFDKMKKTELKEIDLKQEFPSISFTAVSVEEESEKNKIEKIFNLLKEKGKIPESFIRPQFKDGTLDYHMTITLGELPLNFKKDLNKEVVLNINSLGISDKAIALGISGDYFSENDYQHITVAFKDLPKDSKEIETWIPLHKPFSITGIIREFDSNKKIIKRGVFDTPIDEANQIQVGNFQAQAVPLGKGSMFPQEKKL